MDVDTAARYAAAYRALRALKVGTDAGLAGYAGGNLPEGRHTLELDDGQHRTLLRHEVYHWWQGLGDGWGRGHHLANIVGEPVPALLNARQAAPLIPSLTSTDPITPDGVEYLVTAGDLYPVYAHRRERSTFAVQVAYLAATRTLAWLTRGGRATSRAERAVERTRLAWTDLRALLPPTVSDETAPPPQPTPTPWPVPAGEGRGHHEADRCVEGLMIAQGHGWLDFLGRDREAASFAVQTRAAGTGRRPTVRRDLPQPGVLPYVLGRADREGLGRLVAYRDGLG